jgi:hypothetical protein
MMARARQARRGEGTVSKHQQQIIAAAKGKLDEEMLGAAWARTAARRRQPAEG